MGEVSGISGQRFDAVLALPNLRGNSGNRGTKQAADGWIIFHNQNSHVRQPLQKRQRSRRRGGRREHESSFRQRYFTMNFAVVISVTDPETPVKVIV